MTEEAVKSTLSRTVKATWPNVTKASELPFPAYWKGVTEWLVFHAPHVGDGFMRELIAGYVEKAVRAERDGITPEAPVVPEAIREIWRRADRREDIAAKRRQEAWDNAAERVDAVRRRFSAPFGGAKISYKKASLF